MYLLMEFVCDSGTRTICVPTHMRVEDVYRILRMHYDNPRELLALPETYIWRADELLYDFDNPDIIGEDEEPHEGA